jgi:hypothetical protein
MTALGRKWAKSVKKSATVGHVCYRLKSGHLLDLEITQHK